MTTAAAVALAPERDRATATTSRSVLSQRDDPGGPGRLPGSFLCRGVEPQGPSPYSSMAMNRVFNDSDRVGWEKTPSLNAV